MNWTGGRLHRHSTTNAPKHKRQAIRKPSQGPQQVTLFHKFTQTKAHDPDQQTPNDKENQTSHPKQSPAISTSLSPSHQSSKEPTRLEHIKRQLLAKTDWAAVSAARPLKITFPQLEELAQFGKRRKLTEADRRRLDKSNNQVSHEERLLFRKGFRKNETSSEVGTIDGLEIRINGKKAGVDQMPTFEDIQQSNLSSQPMLLDREEIVPREQSSASMVSNVMSEDIPTSDHSSVIMDYHSSRTSLLSSPSNIWIYQPRALSGYLSDY